MDARSIWWPAVAMAALTFVIWCRMYASRFAQMKHERISPQRVATSAQAAALLTDSQAADNFRNLFELPVLFYVALAVAASIDYINAWTVGLAWGFVALRVAHSAIHITYNRVIHRFYAHLAGGVVLWALWGCIALALLRA